VQQLHTQRTWERRASKAPTPAEMNRRFEMKNDRRIGMRVTRRSPTTTPRIIGGAAMSSMSSGEFHRAVSGLSWSTIDELVAVLDDAGYWSAKFLQSSDVAKKQHVRRMIKQRHPRWESLTKAENGKPVRVYKQAALLDPDDFALVASDHKKRAAYHERTRAAYQERMSRRFPT
jgi:hypothetical protein